MALLQPRLQPLPTLLPQPRLLRRLLLGGVLHPRTLLYPAALAPLLLVSWPQTQKTNTARMKICSARWVTTRVWILVPLLVLLINLTHPFPSTRLAFTSPWCRRLPTFLLIHSLLPLPALSSWTGFNPSSFGWQLLPSHPIQPLVWPSPILAQRTICFRTSLPSSLTSASLIFNSVWVTIPFFRCWAGVQPILRLG